jgi:hypothetical protein
MPGSHILIPVESEYEPEWPCKSKNKKKSKFLKMAKVYFWHLNIRRIYSTLLHAENKVTPTVEFALMLLY